MAVKCPKCRAENPGSKPYCGDCGSLLPLSGIPDRDFTETIRAADRETATGSTVAGRYQVIEELGEGGMGKVFKVFDTKVKEKVALKLIKPEISADRGTIERFANELRLARKVRHKNVCGMFDIGEAGGTHYITMEYVQGEDLRSMIRMSAGLTLRTALSIGRQICAGLAEAHSLGIVHRDLKPRNIMIDKDGNAKIMDFGIARALREKGTTGEGAMIGTPEYMSPEQVEGKETDERSDLYALGVILYEMVTGRVPFQGDTPLSIALKHKSEAPKDPRELNARLPERLSRVILRCLEKDREKRFPSAAAVSAELGDIESDVIAAGGAAPAGRGRVARGKKSPFRLTRLIVPFLMLVLAVIGSVLWRAFPGKRPAGTPGGFSVAVLPFEDLSPQKDQEYFCDGMTEELINRLSNIKGLKVPARTSAFAFKGKVDDIREIGGKLNVQTVLEGSIRKIGNQLRVTAQLINISDGFHLWSETYNRELRDVFDIWDEIALTITDKLKLTLLHDEKARLVKRSTENPEAYNLYLLGRYFLSRATDEEDFNKVMGYFDSAMAEDPGYAPAYAGQATCYNLRCLAGYLSPKEGYPKAKEALEKALELDEGLAEAHAALGYFKMAFDWDFAGAEREFNRALSLSPGNLDVYLPYSMYLTAMGRFEEAIAGLERVIDLDPISPAIHIFLGEWGYQFAGRYDESIAQIKKGLDMDPSILYGQLFLASAYALKGMHREAVAQADRVTAASPKTEDLQICSFLGWVYAVSGEKKKALGLLNRMLELRSKRYVDAYLIGEVYAGLGEREKAFEWLNKACGERSGQIVLIGVDPWIENLRSDPRYGALLRKIGFEK